MDGAREAKTLDLFPKYFFERDHQVFLASRHGLLVASGPNSLTRKSFPATDLPRILREKIRCKG